jgi:hypothetical protein
MVFLFLTSDYLISSNILFLSFSRVQLLLKLDMVVIVMFARLYKVSNVPITIISKMGSWVNGNYVWNVS